MEKILTGIVFNRLTYFSNFVWMIDLIFDECIWIIDPLLYRSLVNGCLASEEFKGIVCEPCERL